MDYILITVITMYFVVTSMAGIRNMGIWFFWIRVSKGPTSTSSYLKNCVNTLLIAHFLLFQLYKIRPKRTRPQALLFLCMILLLIVLHTSYMIYSLAPQYVMYGSQKYLVQVRTFPCISRFLVLLMRASTEDVALTMAVSASQWVQTTPVQLGVDSSMVSTGWQRGF